MSKLPALSIIDARDSALLWEPLIFSSTVDTSL